MDEVERVADDTEEANVSSASATQDVKRRKFVDECELLLKDIDTGAIELLQIQALASTELTGNTIDCDIVLRIANNVPRILNHVDVRVKESYFILLKLVFQHCTDYNEAMSMYYADFMKKNNCPPNWKQSYKKYDLELTELLNRMGSHTQFQEKEELLNDICVNFAWLFFLSPKPTTWSVLTHCFKTKQIVPSVLKVFRRLRAVRQLALDIEGTGANGLGKAQVSMILKALRCMLQPENNLFADELRSATDGEWERYIYLVVAFSRERHAVQKETKTADEGGGKQAEQYGPEVLDEAVLSGAEILKGIVLPELFERSHLLPMLELVSKLVGAVGSKISPFSWTTDPETANCSGTKYYTQLSAPLFLKLLFDIYTQSGAEDNEVKSVCLKILPALGARFSDDRVVFGKKATLHVLDYLNGCDWALKFAILTWFSEPLGTPKRQIPTGLYKALSGEVRQNFEQVTVDFDFMLSDCFLRSLFELAKIAPQLAMDFIQNGFAVEPSSEGLHVKIAYEFLTAVSDDSLNTFGKFSTVYETLKGLLRTLDSPLKPLMPLVVTESALYGLRLVEPLAVLSNVVMIAKNMCKDGTGYTGDQGHIFRWTEKMADKLLEYFCSLTKIHLDSEIIDLRRSNLPYVPNIKDPLNIPDDVKIKRVTRVYTQLSEMFFIASLISQHWTQLPACLKILLVTISKYQKEVMDLLAVQTLDDLDNDSRAGAVFYGYANADEGPSTSKASNSEVHRMNDQKKIGSLPKEFDKRVKSKVFANFDPSTFEVVHSESYEKDLVPSEYFTKVARQIKDDGTKTTVLNNIDDQIGAKRAFHAAVGNATRQNGNYRPGGRSQRPGPSKRGHYRGKPCNVGDGAAAGAKATHQNGFLSQDASISQSTRDTFIKPGARRYS